MMLNNKVALITGGSSGIGLAIAARFIKEGAKVVIAGRSKARCDAAQKQLETIALAAQASDAVDSVSGDVSKWVDVKKMVEKTVSRFGKIDILINGAGGNHPKSTTSADQSFFDIPADAFNWVMQLNLGGTVLPSQVFGKRFAEQGYGNILNISSMNAFRPLTRIPAYSAAKAAVSNFTQWLAVHMAQDYSQNIRVNAIAPGFFLTNQNRFLLTDEKTGEPTKRGKSIIEHTPMGRYGNPDDLIGTIVWLLSDASAFVSGIVVPIDGGFSAFSGV